MSPEDLPDYLLAMEVHDCFELDPRTIFTQSDVRLRERRRLCAKLHREKMKKLIPDYAEMIRNLSFRD